MTSVTVVIACSDRPVLLGRALATVRSQDVPHSIEVLLVVGPENRLPASQFAQLLRTAGLDGAVVSASYDRGLADFYPSARMARKRNVGARAASGDYIAYLDDDNAWRPAHLATLVDAAALAGGVAYSWRSLHWSDGRPYDGTLYPWIKPPYTIERAAYVYAQLAELGVLQGGSSVMRDALRIGDEVVATVDSGEWLIAASVLAAVPFPEAYTFREVSHGVTDDLKFCQMVDRMGLSPACTGLPTLQYFLGGHTTAWLEEALSARRSPKARPAPGSRPRGPVRSAGHC